MRPRSVWRQYLVAAGLVLGLVSAEAPWITVQVPTGASASAGWAAVAPASFSLALAAVAAWGASLLTPPLVTRVLGVAQLLLAAGSALALGRALVLSEELITRVAADASGVPGVFSVAETLTEWGPGWIAVSGVAIIAVFLSGVVGAWNPGTDRRTQKYDRSAAAAEADPWESLSDGVDPTDR